MSIEDDPMYDRYAMEDEFGDDLDDLAMEISVLRASEKRQADTITALRAEVERQAGIIEALRAALADASEDHVRAEGEAACVRCDDHWPCPVAERAAALLGTDTECPECKGKKWVYRGTRNVVGLDVLRCPTCEAVAAALLRDKDGEA